MRPRTGFLLRRFDPSLVHLPDAVQSCCRVYRNFVDSDREACIWEELTPLLVKDGETAYDVPSKVEEKVVRNVSVDLYGFENFQKVRDFNKMQTKNIPGLPFSPTLVEVMKKDLPWVMNGLQCDSARIVEHHRPGYEMHVESPTVGPIFAYLSLLSDTVMSFDNEAARESGNVLVPARSLMIVSGALRWGWRFGERTTSVHQFGSRKIAPEYRLSLQMWKAAHGMADRQALTESGTRSIASAQAENKDSQHEETLRLLRNAAQDPSQVLNEVAERDKGRGLLGGDYVEGSDDGKKTLQGSANNFAQTKSDFGRFAQTIQFAEEKRTRGEEVSEDWLKTQFGMIEGAGPDRDGFDVNNPEASWGGVETKAMYYRAKLKDMKYDERFEKADETGSLVSQSVQPGQVAQTDKKRQNMTESLKGMEYYAKRLGYSQFNTESTSAMLQNLPKGLPDISKIPDIPGADIEIEVDPPSGSSR